MYFALVGTWLKRGKPGGASLAPRTQPFMTRAAPIRDSGADGASPGQSAVIPASLTTLAHSAPSALMISANCPSGALLASQPATSSFSRTSAVASAASSALLMRATTGVGVPVGTTIPNHGVTCASAKPCSARVGTSGKYLV